MVGEVDNVQSSEQLLSQPQSQEQSEQERLFTQREMSEVAKRERERAYEKGKREALADAEKQKSEQVAPRGFQANPLAQNAQSLSADDIKQMIAQEAPALLQKQLADVETQTKTKQIVDSFVNKIDSAKERFPELETQLNDLDFGTFAPIVTLANDMENTADIMHELIQNPMKLGNLLSLMHSQPKMAARAMYELSNSIKQNQKALQNSQYAQEPSEQFRSSVRNNGKNDDSMSVTDFRKIFRG